MTLSCMDCGLPVKTKECVSKRDILTGGCGHSRHCKCASADDDILSVEI